jgi:O-antigen/teichoic acid export membrane protein
VTASDFLRSTKIVFLGMAAAQSIPILGSLFIARLYSPSDFGVFSAWLGLVLTAAVLVTGRFETALAVEHDGEPRKFAFVATLTTIVLVSLALTVVAIAVSMVVPSTHSFPTGLVIVSLPLTLLMAVVQTWQSWAAAEGEYRKLSAIRIAQALGVTGSQVVAGWIAPNALSLAYGHLVGVLFGTIVAIYFMPINFRAMKPWSKFRPDLIQFWKSRRRFPLFSLPADLINTASGQIPMLIIASKFGAEASGLYALTVRVLGAPIGLLGVAVLDVFKRSAASSFRSHGHCRDDYIRTFRLLGAGGVLLAIGVMFAAESVFVIVFGESWRQSGIIAVWLMPMFALRLVASPLSYVFYIVGKQQIDLIWQCALLAMTLAAFTLFNTFQFSVELYAFGYAFLYVVYLALSYIYSKGKYAEL